MSDEHELADTSLAFKFTSFSNYQMGRGFVAFELTDQEKARGEYDPHVMFCHNDSESYDPEVSATVERECRELAQLLNKFRVADECISAHIIESRRKTG